MRKRKFSRISRAVERVADLGMELHARRCPALGFSKPGDRARGRRGDDAESRRAASRPSRRGSSRRSAPARARRRAPSRPPPWPRPARTPVPRSATPPPARLRDPLHPVAEPEHRNAHRRRIAGGHGRPALVHALRPAREDDARSGFQRRISSSDAVGGRTTEKTRASRMRRAISCVYWPPKSRTTIGVGSAHASPARAKQGQRPGHERRGNHGERRRRRTGRGAASSGRHQRSRRLAQRDALREPHEQRARDQEEDREGRSESAAVGRGARSPSAAEERPLGGGHADDEEQRHDVGRDEEDQRLLEEPGLGRGRLDAIARPTARRTGRCRSPGSLRPCVSRKIRTTRRNAEGSRSAACRRNLTSRPIVSDVETRPIE